MRVRCLLVLLAAGLPCFGQDNRGYYRYPAIHGDTMMQTSFAGQVSPLPTAS